MILSRRIALGGTELDSVDERILICGFEEDEPETSRSALSLYGGDGMGSWLSYEHISCKKVTVKFNINTNKRDYAGRNEVLEKVTAWAHPGGLLTSSTRPDRRIRVRSSGRPKIADPRKMDTEYSLTFEAREKPYWENVNVASAQSGVSAGTTVRLAVDGNLTNALEVELLNKSGARINNATITCGVNMMKFTNLALVANEALVIRYDDRNLQEILIREAPDKYRHAAALRSGADDFIVEPGIAVAAFTADRACQMTIRCAGRYA